MPIYRYECECGEFAEEFRKIADRNRGPICHNCRLEMRRGIERANVNPDYEPYLDPNLVPMHSTSEGTWVKSRQHRRELMANLGLTEW